MPDTPAPPVTDNLDLDADILQMSEDDFHDVFAKVLGQNEVKEDQVVRGRVTAIDGDRVTVDIGFKSEGVIALDEFLDDNGEPTIQVGDEVEVYYEGMDEEDGTVRLSKRRADEKKAWEEIARAFDNGDTVRGRIVSRVKGGLKVDIGVKAFLPGSQVDLRPVKHLDKLVGEEFDFRIIKFNRKRGNIVLSRRALLEEERERKRAKTIERIKELLAAHPDDPKERVMRGVVKNITDYGAFVDLGGIDGLLHITDVSHKRLTTPEQLREIVDIGQTIDVAVLKYDEESQRVSLGKKQLEPDPWEEVDIRYPVGAVVRGRVVRMQDFGIFVELEEGVEGLVHISEMTWNKRVKHPGKLVNVGDFVEAMVIGVDKEDKRISLSMRRLEPNPWDLVEQRYPVGSIVKGTVRNIADFGIFVGIDEGIDGLVHISDLSWSQRVRHPSDLYKKGDVVEARVLNIDRENERFSLGIKQLREDPWLSVQSRYFLGQVVKGRVVSRTDFGIFVEIEEGVEGLVHLSELAVNPDADPNWQDHYPDGKEIMVEIRRIDQHERRISLSERGAIERGAEDGDYVAQQPDGQATLGDVLGSVKAKLMSQARKDEKEGGEAPAPEAD